MRPNEREIVDRYRTEILDFLVQYPSEFLVYLEENGVIHSDTRSQLGKSAAFDRDAMFETLKKLKVVDNGWTGLIGFLKRKGCENLLIVLVNQDRNNISCRESTNLDWCQFIRVVTDFFLGNYRVVESFHVDGDSHLIESAWVDLQLEGSKEPFSDYKEIFTQMRAKNCRLAIVRGQPGSGKTTLAKKIAYDWAKEEKKEIFDLILAVPLRDIQSKSDLLEMAVEYHRRNDHHYDAKRICADLKRKKLKILVVLDGYDEFQVSPDSPLAKIFGSQPASTEPFGFDFDLLITSRPFACQLSHATIATVRYEILGFTEAKKVEFVTKRCTTLSGKLRVLMYLFQSRCAMEICQNPLILTLICFLSDLREPIPLTLTKIYGTFVHRMLIRAAEKNAIGKFDRSNWQQYGLLKNLGCLALFGVIKNQFQFSQEEMQMCHVTKEDFHSGLLQYRSDPVGLALQCDFPHRSIQDFLAAFYAVHYWGDKTLTEATGWLEIIWSAEVIDFIPQMKVESLMALLHRTDSQFGRLFFGLISGRKDFSDRFRVVAEEIFCSFKTFLLSPVWCILVGYDMADCSDEENFTAGQTVSETADLTIVRDSHHPTKLEEKKLKFVYGGNRDNRHFSVSSLFDQLTEQFRLGLNLCQIGEKSGSFSVGKRNRQHLKILYLHTDDDFVIENIGKHFVYSHVCFLSVYMRSLLPENMEVIQNILTQIPVIKRLVISEMCQGAHVNMTIGLKAHVVDSPQRFSLEHLRLYIGSVAGKKILKSFQSSKSNVFKVATVKPWKLFDNNQLYNFSVSVDVVNDMSNLNIWQEVMSTIDLTSLTY